MRSYADLEISLHRRDADSYGVELRFSQPDSDADVRLMRRGPSLVDFDFDRLRALALDTASYGQLLSKSLFANPDVRTAFSQANSVVQARDMGLRLRLFIGPSAPELHSLRWETLCDPHDGSFLLTAEHTLFSRYLSSLDWRPVRLRPKADLRALVVVANPTNLTDYEPGGRQLAPLDVAGGLDRVKSGLGSIPVTLLASSGSATLENLSTCLHDGCDILYLVCHGTLIKNKPHLWLEDKAGKVDVVNGSELVTRLRDLEQRQRPRLVILASCQSAGDGTDGRDNNEGALAALGPRLAEAGIPAVLAMQGEVTMQTEARFMLVFFQELQQDGRIDRAMAMARGAVREQPDWWAPVLFMRLKSGRIWYAPGFPKDRGGLEKWPALISHIRQKRCTPILGPGLAQPLLGSRREIAQRWAETYCFPMAPHDCEDLPQVAQYLAVDQDRMFPREKWVEYLRQEVLCRYVGDLPDALRDGPLDGLLAIVAAQNRRQDPAEPHQVLSALPLPIYITADSSNLLIEALVDAGKDPQVDVFRWKDDLGPLPSIYDDEPDYRPDMHRPLVYHLFGRLQEPNSLVLTEDDYFDYLIGVTRDKDLIPGVVRWALADTALLFLGFQMDDWNFRVLFRSIVSQEGRYRRRKYAHVAVQIDPEEDRVLEPELARRYLESYFWDADISIYWGSVRDFVRELQRHWDGGAL